ncbi:PREDICTED: nucleolar protein 12 [Mandrillus leucophaeus]|uniref:nucleolar protein 12 n=1 Tax=Mandrillus leucophaeus TaxID=9568 RepID=UPI0005F4C5D2|nr:PREDICTED: nucleolar protein 12 [Mandrillus leucophaeus]
MGRNKKKRRDGDDRRPRLVLSFDEEKRRVSAPPDSRQLGSQRRGFDHPSPAQSIGPAHTSLHAHSRKKVKRKHPQRTQDSKKPPRATRTSKAQRRRLTGKARHSGERSRQRRAGLPQEEPSEPRWGIFPNRHQEYLKMLAEREEALEEADELDRLVTAKTESVQYDHPNHTVTVTTISDLDLSGARLLGLTPPEPLCVEIQPRLALGRRKEELVGGGLREG